MKNLHKLGIAILMASSVPSFSNAEEQDVEARGEFRTTLSVTNSNPLDFGTIDFGANAGAVNIVMNPDTSTNTPTISDSSNYIHQNDASNGSVEIEGQVGSTVNIACTASATMTNANGDSIVISSVQITTPGGTAQSCSGIGNAISTFNLTSGVDTVTVGGSLNLTAAPAEGVYSSSNNNGVPIRISALYQ